jgi:hypothetical protein
VPASFSIHQETISTCIKSYTSLSLSLSLCHTHTHARINTHTRTHTYTRNHTHKHTHTHKSLLFLYHSSLFLTVSVFCHNFLAIFYVFGQRVSAKKKLTDKSGGRVLVLTVSNRLRNLTLKRARTNEFSSALNFKHFISQSSH